jgi:hypothetical protein
MTSLMKPWQWLIVSAALLLVITYVDYKTGYELQFFLFYFLPISIAALRMKRISAYSIAVASAFCWLAADIFSRHPYSNEWFRFWNSLIRLAAFSIVAELLIRAQYMANIQRRLNEDLSHALEQVKLLQGLLPVCCSCKKIRNKEEEWEQMESYIQRHSEADFTHGICPECAEKLYPGLMANKGRGTGHP